MAKPSPDDSSSGPAHVLEKILATGSDLPDPLRLTVIGVVAIVAMVVFAQLADVPDAAIWAVVLLVLAGVGFQLFRGGSPDLRPRMGERLTVGVLSFAELGTAGDEEALGDGFAEELITRLSRVEELNVKPRHAMLKIKGKGLSTREIARRLGAHYIVEGTLRRHGEELRVDAGVVQVWDGDHWRHPWQGDLAGLFGLQSDVAEGVAEHLVGRLEGTGARPLDSRERSAVRRAPAGSVEANVAYMRGRSNRRRFNNGRERDHFLSAEKAFHEALALDPEYVDAWAELGFLYLLHWETDGGSGWLERAAAAFREVQRRAPEQGVAASELGYIALVSGRIDEALELVETSARRHEGETIPQNVRALLYWYLGFYESAVQLTERIVELDPDYVYPPTNASTCSALMGRFDEALAWAGRAKEIDATAFIVWLVEGVAWFHKGRFGAAHRAWMRGVEVAPASIDPLFEVCLAWIEAARGDRATARAAVAAHRDDLWLGGAYDPYFISLCSMAGEHDLALDLLERQATYGASYRYLLGDPTLRPLREHPRFADLLQRRRVTWEALVGRLGDQVPVPPVTVDEAARGEAVAG